MFLVSISRQYKGLLIKCVKTKVSYWMEDYSSNRVRESVRVNQGFSITRFSDRDKQEMLASSAQFGNANRGIAFVQNVFETFVEVPKVIGDSKSNSSSPGPYEIARQQFDAACEALRLFQQGVVGFNYVWLKNTTWVLEGGTAIRWSSAPTPFLGEAYVLARANDEQFREFWKKMAPHPLFLKQSWYKFRPIRLYHRFSPTPPLSLLW